MVLYTFDFNLIFYLFPLYMKFCISSFKILRQLLYLLNKLALCIFFSIMLCEIILNPLREGGVSQHFWFYSVFQNSLIYLFFSYSFYNLYFFLFYNSFSNLNLNQLYKFILAYNVSFFFIIIVVFNSLQSLFCRFL